MIVVVQLPLQLARLAGIDRTVPVEIGEVASLRAVLDALEEVAPALKGTIRAHNSGQRRDFVRFYIGADDYSHTDIDASLPHTVTHEDEPLRIVAAIAGG